MATDKAAFNPTRTFYILQHNLFCTNISVFDLTNEFNITLTGGFVSSASRDAARCITEDKAVFKKPVYQFIRNTIDTWTGRMTSPTSLRPNEELASWKENLALTKIKITFPPNSTHCKHALNKHQVQERSHYTNVFVKDSIEYVFQYDDVVKPCHIALVKRIDGREVVVARYAQRWMSGMTAGGVLLVDGEQVDEVVAVLTIYVELRRLERTWWERFMIR